MIAPGLPAPESLSLAAQVAQLIVVRASGYGFDHQRRYPQWELATAELQDCIESLGIGGVIVLGGSAIDVGVRSRQLQSWASIPLLVAADIEEGVGQRFAGATHFPPPMALSAIANQDLSLGCHYAEAMGRVTAQEAIAIGINWLLAPVVDINNNPDNPVINVRAFGETPEHVSQLSQAFIRGAQHFPVLTTAKHFPGHGDTAVDSHLQLPVIPYPRARLEQVELAPFRQAITAGVDAIMTAHLQVPELDQQLPATLSAAILTDMLRRGWGFEGIVVTDALIMGAITQHYGPYEAAVMALEAGADILLMPQDVKGTIQAICEAVQIGRLSTERIQASLARVWRAKQKVGHPLMPSSATDHRWEHHPPPPVQLDALATPTARDLMSQMTTASMQQRGQLPSQTTATLGQSLIVVDDVLATEWLNHQAPAIAIPTQHGYQPRLLDNGACALSPDTLHQPGLPTLLQLFSRGNPFRGNANLSPMALHWLRYLQRTNCLVGLVVYGSPYVLDGVLAELRADIPYGFVYGQMPEAQAAILSVLWPEPQEAMVSTAFTD